MGKLFVIMGKSATGKDSLYQEIVKRHPELQEIVSYTTRPIRAGETYGKEYFFVSKEEMHEMREQGKLIECRKYDTVHGPWFYFTADDGQIDLKADKKYILISTLEGYEKLQSFYGIENIVPIYIEVDDLVRLERALVREKLQKSPCAQELCRRFMADEEDFDKEKLKMAGIERRIRNDDFDEAVENIEKLISNIG
nr:guanylate kinase [Eubacterium sp.]